MVRAMTDVQVGAACHPALSQRYSEPLLPELPSANELEAKAPEMQLRGFADVTIERTLRHYVN